MSLKDFWRRFCKNKAALIGIFIVWLFCMSALFAPLLAPFDPRRIDLRHPAEPPSSKHLLGTDHLGRDILSRILFGARVSISISLSIVILSGLFGSLLGLVAGYYGGLVDFVAMRVVDVLLAFPSFLLALAVVSFLGPGLNKVILAVTIAAIPRFSRLMRGSVLSVKSQEYVQSALAIGANSLRIMFRHILPNSFAPVLVQGTLMIANSVLIVAGLGFLGLGAQPPTPEWGVMVSDGRGFLRVAPHIAAFPGCAIMLFALGFNLLGDGIRDAFDVEME